MKKLLTALALLIASSAFSQLKMSDLSLVDSIKSTDQFFNVPQGAAHTMKSTAAQLGTFMNKIYNKPGVGGIGQVQYSDGLGKLVSDKLFKRDSAGLSLCVGAYDNRNHGFSSYNDVVGGFFTSRIADELDVPIEDENMFSVSPGDVTIRMNGYYTIYIDNITGGAIHSADTITYGSLVANRGYGFLTYQAGDDFSNVGGSNTQGESFVASGTTPTNWTHGSELIAIDRLITNTGDTLGLFSKVGSNALLCNHYSSNDVLDLSGATSFTIPGTATTGDITGHAANEFELKTWFGHILRYCISEDKMSIGADTSDAELDLNLFGKRVNVSSLSGVAGLVGHTVNGELYDVSPNSLTDFFTHNDTSDNGETGIGSVYFEPYTSPAHDLTQVIMKATNTTTGDYAYVKTSVIDENSSSLGRAQVLIGTLHTSTASQMLFDSLGIIIDAPNLDLRAHDKMKFTVNNQYYGLIDGRSAHENIAFGYNSLGTMTLGNYNVAIGHRAGELMQNSANAVAIGTEALGNSVNGGNVAIGCLAGKPGSGHDAVYGAFNTLIGPATGVTHDTTNFATCLGLQAVAGFRSIALGVDAITTKPNQLRISPYIIHSFFPNSDLTVADSFKIKAGTDSLIAYFSNDTFRVVSNKAIKLGSGCFIIAADGSVNATKGMKTEGAIIEPPQYSTPTTGSTVTANGNSNLVIDPAGGLLALSVDFPSGPVNGQLFNLSSTQAVTTLTLGNGTILGTLTTLAANDFGGWIYSSSASAWVRRL